MYTLKALKSAPPLFRILKPGSTSSRYNILPMKKMHLKDILAFLMDMKHIIRVPEEARARAKKAVEMISIWTYFLTSSTLRFLALPSSVLLSAIGLSWP
jgi:hypothetical protein